MKFLQSKRSKAIFWILIAAIIVIAAGAFVWLKYHQASADVATTTQSREFNMEVGGTLARFGVFNGFHCTAGPNFQFGYAEQSWSGPMPPNPTSARFDTRPFIYGRYHTLNKLAPSSATQFNGLPIAFLVDLRNLGEYTGIRLSPMINYYFSKVSSQLTILPENMLADLTFTNGQTVERPLGKLSYNPLNPSAEAVDVRTGKDFSGISKIAFSLQSPDKTQKEVLESCVWVKNSLDSALAPVPTLPFSNNNIMSHYGFGLPDNQIEVTQAYDNNISFSEPYIPVTSTQSLGNAIYQVADKSEVHSNFSLQLTQQLPPDTSDPDQKITMVYHFVGGNTFSDDRVKVNRSGSQIHQYLNSLSIPSQYVSSVDIYRTSVSNPSQQKLLISLNYNSFSGESSASKNPDYSALPIIAGRANDPLAASDPATISALNNSKQSVESLQKLTSHSSSEYNIFSSDSFQATISANAGGVASIFAAAGTSEFQALDNPPAPLISQYLIGSGLPWDYLYPNISVDNNGLVSVNLRRSTGLKINPATDTVLPEKYTVLIYKKRRDPSHSRFRAIHYSESIYFS